MIARGNDGARARPEGDLRVFEALVLTFAGKLEEAARDAGTVPRSTMRPMTVARPVLDALGAVALGMMGATVSMVLIFVIVNMLLHLQF